MPAIEAKTFSGYDGLRQIELPKPQPAKDRVLVRITAAGVTPLDQTILSGRHPRAKAPLVLGNEGAGVIQDATAGRYPANARLAVRIISIWILVLESLTSLQGYDTIIIGHDMPVDRSAIDSTMTYVKRAKDIHAAAADAKTYSENLKAAFPDLQQAGFVDLSASYLYAAPH